MTLSYIVICVILVSLISIVGLALFGLKEKLLQKVTHLLVSFAAGSLLGSAFIHLLPESIETLDLYYPFLFFILGFIISFVVEKFLHWRHCHKKNCKLHNIAYLNLFGDTVHNFIDGISICVAFLTNTSIGITTTIAIAIHEIPQEIGDFAILIHSGFSKTKAIFYNFLSALSALLGALLAFIFGSHLQNAIPYLMAIVAGGFVYLASCDLIPELHKTIKIKDSILQLAFLILGILLMLILKKYLIIA